VSALNARRSSWSRLFPQHPRAAGGGGGHRRWRRCRCACSRRGVGRWTTARTTRARTRRRAAARMAPAGGMAAAVSTAAVATVTATSPPRRCDVADPSRTPRRRQAGGRRHRRPRWGAIEPPTAAAVLALDALPDCVAPGRAWGTPDSAPRCRWSSPLPADGPRRRRVCACVGRRRCWPPRWFPAPQGRHHPTPRGSGRGHASAAPPTDGAGAPGRAHPGPLPAPRRRACALTAAAAVARHRRLTRAVEVNLCLRGVASCQSTPSEGARDALVYLSLCENGFFVSKI